ncbi:MAG: GGDEF domain-containing protein [Lachnospiraceae bacterium]|nr:GGDEF domain-containing protein [Lachnospiraceae bacterium]
MKKIAVFLGDMSSEFQIDVAEAIKEETKRREIAVFLYSNAGVYGSNIFYSNGEKNIIYLPHLEDYDGIIVAGDTFGIDNMDEELTDLLYREAKCPIVCIRQKDERFSNVLVDDYSAMCTMVEHFIVHHGFKRVCFMTGRLEMYDAQRRLLAYINTMQKYGLKVTPEMIYEGDYWRNRGDEAVEWLLQDPDNWPEVIVCSNDYMAISICNALNKRGIKIPQQICVSGYDDIEEARCSMPPLSTIQIRCDELGKAAVELLVELYETKCGKKDVYIAGAPVYRDSCCVQEEWDVEPVKRLLADKEYIKRVFFTLTAMWIAFESEEDYKSLMLAAHAYIIGKPYGQIFVCLCKQEETEQESSALQQRYSDKMVLKTIIEKDECEFMDLTFDRRDILPSQYLNPDDLVYIHPLHGLNRCLGYVVVKNCELRGVRYFLTRWVQDIGNSLERQLMYEESKELMEMRKNYRQDALTGIGNRREMDNALRKYSDILPVTGGFCIISADMDDLKLINDCYGHLEGDVALCEVAKILKEVVGNKGVAARIGGDEFLICLNSNQQEVAEKTIEQIRERMMEFNKKSVKPWYLHASMGYAFCRNRNSILFAMEQADKNMYEEKRIWKSKRKYRGASHEK